MAMRPLRLLAPAGWLAISTLIISCASSTPAPTPAAATTSASHTGTPTTGTTAPKPADNDYIIGPGDTLQVFVWRNPELSVSVPVRPDGKISTPLVENMTAVGKTPSQLARDM